MESKYDRLTQLKKLLDSGALNQDEFDAAKKRILDTEDSTNISPVPPIPKGNKTPASLSKSASKKWILWGTGGVLAIIILLIVVCNKGGVSQINTNGNQDWGAAKAESDAQFEEALAMAADMNEDDGLSIGNPWRKGYFKNEWGEDNPNLPYIYTTISGSAWDIHVGYESAKSTKTASGVFGIYIMDEHGHTSMYAPVNILIRGADGETKNVPVTDVTDGVAYITDPGAVAVLMDYLNTDQFDILLEFDKYNERHKTKAHWWSEPGFFNHAIETML